MLDKTNPLQSPTVALAWQAYITACLKDAPITLKAKLVKDWADAYRNWRKDCYHELTLK